MSLDLASMAKSWAAQQAVQLLHSFPAAVDAAGDIVVCGTSHGNDA